jgi:flavin-dependent dehydrogenase
MRLPHPLIAGGGPAGSAIAILLARGGARPMLIERTREPHDVVCGGFLGADAIALLGRLGIDVALLGAHPIHRIRVVAGGREMETHLPFAAAGLSRRTLDATMIAMAAREGAAVERGVTVRAIDLAARRLDLADGTVLESDRLFIATGKHDVRGGGRPVDAPGSDPAIGFRIAITPSPALTAALTGVIELHLFRHGYAGLLLQEDGNANLCLSVAQSRLRDAGGRPETLIPSLGDAPRLGERLDMAVSTGSWSSIARIAYGWRQQAGVDGIFRLGDQAAVIASLAGDGIAIALASAHHASAACLSKGPDGAIDFQHGFSRHVRRPLALAGLLRGAGENGRVAGPLIALLGHCPGLVRLAASATRVGSR